MKIPFPKMSVRVADGNFHRTLQGKNPETTDVCMAFLPLYFLSSLFGIMPLNYKFCKKKAYPSDVPMHQSTIKLAFSILLLVVTIVHALSAPFYVLHTCLPNLYKDGIFKFQSVILTNITVNDRETKQSLIMKILNPLLITLICLTARIVAVFSLRPRLKKFFCDFNEVDRFLKHIAGHEKYINVRKHFIYGLNITVIFVVLGLPINISYLIRVAEVNNQIGVIWCGILVWSNLTGFCCDVMFVFCTHLIRVRFKIINNTLSNLVKEENDAAAFQYSMNFQQQFSKQLWILPEKALLNYNVFKYKNNLRKNIMFGKSLADTIEVYRHCHRLLCKLVRFLNKMYKVHLLMTLAACFLKSLFNIYFAMFGYVIGTATSRSKHTNLEYFSTAYWNSYYILRFLMVTGMAHVTAAQGVKTRYLISALNSRFLDSNTKEELSLFMNHITNTKIEFTACDFFTLNTHLITSAIAAGTTYLVILVQFHSDKD